MKNALIVLITVLVLVQIANGADFAFTTEKTSESVCPSTTSLLTLNIRSLADDNKFTITSTGDALTLATIVPSAFILDNNEIKTVYLYVTPKSTTKTGNYNLDVSVSSSSSTEKIRYLIYVTDCRKTSITVAKPLVESCPCDLVKYDFVVTNLGNYQENYNLKLGGDASDYITLSETSLSLAPSQSKSVYAYLKNLCTVGKRDFTVTLERQGNTIMSATATADIKPCFDFMFDSEHDKYSFCEEPNKIQFRLVNIGTNKNTYELSVSGPSWGILEKNSVALNPGETTYVNLLLKPDYSSTGGSFEAKALSDKGQIEAKKKIDVEIRKCHSVLLDIVQENEKICNTLTKDYNLIIKNDGEKDETYILKSDTSWARLSEGTVSLKSGEEKRLVLTINPQSEVNEGKHTITISAETLDKGRKVSDSIDIETLTHGNCYKAAISAEDLVIAQDSVATIAIPVENKGTEKAEYVLEVSGTAVNFVRLNPAVLTVEPGKADITYLYVAPDGEKPGSYEATISVKLKDSTIIASKTIKIDLSETVISTTNVIEIVESASNVTGVVMAGSLASNKITLIVIALVVVLILYRLWRSISFLFEEQETKKEEKSSRKFYLALLVMLFAFIAVAVKYDLDAKIVAYVLAYKLYVVVGLVILVFFYLVHRFVFKSEEAIKINAETKEEAKEAKQEGIVAVKGDAPEGKSNLWMWILVIISIIVMAYLLIKFNTYVLVYKYYALAGIVLLLIIVLLIRYYKEILNFFEEDGEEVDRAEPRSSQQGEELHRPTRSDKLDREEKPVEETKKEEKQEKPEKEKKKSKPVSKEIETPKDEGDIEY